MAIKFSYLDHRLVARAKNQSVAINRTGTLESEVSDHLKWLNTAVLVTVEFLVQYEPIAVNEKEEDDPWDLKHELDLIVNAVYLGLAQLLGAKSEVVPLYPAHAFVVPALDPALLHGQHLGTHTLVVNHLLSLAHLFLGGLASSAALRRRLYSLERLYRLPVVAKHLHNVRHVVFILQDEPIDGMYGARALVGYYLSDFFVHLLGDHERPCLNGLDGAPHVGYCLVEQ